MWFRNFFLLFIAIAIAEIYVLIAVGGLIGTLPTIMLVLLTGIIGVSMLKKQGFSVFSRLQEKMRQGQAPAQEMVEGVLLIIAGAFLITPGFVTDVIGFLWLIPPTREYVAKVLVKTGMFKVQGMAAGSNFNQGQDPFGHGSGDAYDHHRSDGQNSGRSTQSHGPQRFNDGKTIDGEYERKDDE